MKQNEIQSEFPVIPTRNLKQEEFIISLTGAAMDHDTWLAIIRFGLPTLLEDSRFLIELIGYEAQKITKTTFHRAGRSVQDELSRILDELGLKLVVKD